MQNRSLSEEVFEITHVTCYMHENLRKSCKNELYPTNFFLRGLFPKRDVKAKCTHHHFFNGCLSISCSVFMHTSAPWVGSLLLNFVAVSKNFHREFSIDWSWLYSSLSNEITSVNELVTSSHIASQVPRHILYLVY